MENYKITSHSTNYSGSDYSQSQAYRFLSAGLKSAPPYLSVDMSRDACLFAELLQPVQLEANDSLVNRIFGSQMQQQGLSLAHSLQLLEERIQLHKRILRDIDHRHVQLQEQLFGAELHAKLDDHRRALRVQQSLLQLEGERRKEDVAFWQDTVSLRDRAFETAQEYRAVRGRMSVLADIEAGGYAYG